MATNTKMPLKDKILIIVCLIAMVILMPYMWWISTDKNAYKIPNSVAIGLLGIMCLTLFINFIIKVVKSFKYGKQMKEWRKTIKNGDDIMFYTGEQGMDYDAKVISDNGDKCVIQIEVYKSRLHKNKL